MCPLNRHRWVVASEFVRQRLPLRQSRQWDILQEKGQLFVQGVRSRGCRSQQQHRSPMPCRDRGRHRRLRGLRHTKARGSSPCSNQGLDHVGYRGRQADELTSQGAALTRWQMPLAITLALRPAAGPHLLR